MYNAQYIPGAVLSFGDIMMNERDIVFAFIKFIFNQRDKLMHNNVLCAVIQ